VRGRDVIEISNNPCLKKNIGIHPRNKKILRKIKKEEGKMYEPTKNDCSSWRPPEPKKEQVYIDWVFWCLVFLFVAGLALMYFGDPA